MYKKLIYRVCFVLLLGMLLMSVAEADLVSWWRFEEGSGDIANDSSGNGHHGTLIGTPEWVSGPEGFGGAVAFDPNRCMGVDCGVFDPTNGTGKFTLALWAFWDGTGTFQHFLTKSNGWGADTMMFQIELWGARDEEPYTDRVGLSYQGNVSSYTSAAGSTPFSIMPKNEWVHLAFTFDGTNATVYVNGVDEVGHRPFSIGPNVDAPVLIGLNYKLERTFHGSLDEIYIYSRSLTGREINPVMTGVGISHALASDPYPPDGAANVPPEVTLTWRPGAYVEGLSPKHRLFFGENFDDVNDDIRGIEQDVERYPIDGSLSLNLDKTYYWRIDEANSTTGWDVGAFWQFAVADYFVVDDFEGYKDSPAEDQIFSTWIDGWEVETNGAIVSNDADLSKGEHYAETTIVHGGKQSMPFFYNNSGPANYSEAARLFSPAQDWTREGVGVLSLWFKGHPAYLGGFGEGPTGTYTMTASGTDIWDNSDEFHFAWKEVSGAVSISAKVESMENTDPFAKAGVMIRDTLEADSANAALLITPENGVRFQFRNATGGDTERFFEEGITAPQWVKLELTLGGLVRAYYSADGKTWTQLNLTTVAMDAPMYIGLALTSHNTALTCEAKFSNVTSDGTGQWVNQDIGMLSNEAEPMYVTVKDGSGASATVYHDDPDAALIDMWTEWNFDLQEFSDAGVVLTDVSRLSIGFGDADNPQPGGSGLVFFDDIRLYLPR